MYSERENGFVCRDCLSNAQTENRNSFFLSKTSLTYLQAVSVLKPNDVREIIIDEKTMIELKDFCYFLIQNVCGTRFLSLESGIAIL